MKLTLENMHAYCCEDGGCFIWKLGRHKYPIARLSNGGPVQQVARYVFTDLLHKRVPDGRVLSQRCGNTRCIAPGCLHTITRSEVLRRRHARSGPGAYLRLVARVQRKLSFELAREIRGRQGTDAALAKEYEVSRTAIRDVRTGRSWREVFTASSVFAIAP